MFRTRRRPRLDPQNFDLWCRPSMFAVEGSAHRVPAERVVGTRASCAHPGRGRRRARLDRRELARSADRSAASAADLGTPADDMAAGEMLERAISLARTPMSRCSCIRGDRQAAAGLHRAAGLDRQAAAHLRQDAVDHDAEASAASVLRSRRRRRRGAQPEPAAAESAAGQRPRHHPGAPTRYSVSRVEHLDQELHAGPCRGARTARTTSRTRQPGAVSADLRKWFEEHTHRAMRNRLEDGSDLDVDQYVSHYIDLTTGEAIEPRIFRELAAQRAATSRPRCSSTAAPRSVFTAVGSSSSSWPVPTRFRGR